MNRLRIRFLFLIFNLLILVGCATLYNPATGRREFIIIPTDTEVAMGLDVHKSVVKELGLSKDQAQTNHIGLIGERLAKVSDRKDYQYHFFLIDKKDVNAFTGPGGNIYFYSGLLNKLESDDEIAAVLAHEIGHCAARHTIKKFQAAIGYDFIGTLILTQLKMKDQARSATIIASNVAMGLAMSAYSRQDEYEADRLGIKYLYLAGYDPNGMIKTLEVLEKESKGPKTPLILRTHPYPSDRLKAAKREVQQAPAKYGSLVKQK